VAALRMAVFRDFPGMGHRFFDARESHARSLGCVR
jgi:hypothetical protein